jgi:DNA-binding NtrC family response regulator
MPAHIVVVHDDLTFLEPLATALRAESHEVVAFDDPISAWDALRTGSQVELLITRVQFPAGKPHGIALAQWARSSLPDIRVLFTALPGMETYAEGLGMFLPMPASVPQVVEIVARLLATDRSEWDYRPSTI